MVAVHDQRPLRPTDSLKRMVNNLSTPASVPHGIKTARPGEYVNFGDSAGTYHRWDGDAIAEYDSRIAEGAAAVAAAQAHLVEVEAELAEAQERITATNGDLTLYIQRVEAAQEAADTANATLQNLTSELETAQSAVDAVTARTGAVESAVAAADSKAVQANNAATNAANAAQTAQEAAQQGQAEAQNALAKAGEAETKALEAAGIAAGKGKIIYALSAPTGAEAATTNLWIRSSDSKPHRWDGTQWVPITDKAILDAAQAAANAASAAQEAKATADKAVADAAAAASTAQAANLAAGNAQRTADGKTVTLYDTVTPPPAPGVTKGDLYYRTGTDNRIIEHWQWSGSAWVKRAIESGQLVNFDAGYITSGFLDVTKRIRAGSIHADKVFVGIGDNLLPPLSTSASYGDQLIGSNLSASGGYTGGVSIVLPAGTTGIGSYLSSVGGGGDYFIKVNPGSNLHVSVWVKPGEPAGRPTIYTRFINSETKAWTFGTPSIIYQDNLPAGEWYNLSGVVTPPANFVYDRVLVGFYANGNHAETVFSDPAVREMKDGSLIVNGSIAGEKVNAESVAAAVGSFVKVNAENVTVTSELAARVVNAMTAQVKNLVVTESAILQHSTLLGETVAEQLNVTKKLVARDAIVNGTLDVAQLNVTEAMSAEIVSAMSLESKKLVVTDEAILNKATVVQSLVTPELIADRINVNSLGAQLVTSGAIQTDPSANRGVKITNAGVNAWDNNGNQTIRLNGADNLLMGQLATGSSNAGRIRVFNAIHPVNQRPAGFITLQDAGGITASQGVIEYNNSTLQLSIKDGTEQGYSQPFRKGVMVTRDGLVLAGNLAVNGQFSKGGAIAAYSISGGSIPAGKYVSFTQPVPLSNGQRPWSVVQPASSNFANLTAVTWTTNNIIEGRVYNNSNFAASGVWIDILTFGIER